MMKETISQGRFCYASLRLLLMARGAPQEADLKGTTPLHAAVEAGRLEIVRLLLEHLAPVDPSDQDGMTPLLAAAQLGHPDIASTLLAAGANWGAKCDSEASAMHAAASRGFDEVVRVLIEARILPWLIHLFVVVCSFLMAKHNTPFPKTRLPLSWCALQRRAWRWDPSLLCARMIARLRYYWYCSILAMSFRVIKNWTGHSLLSQTCSAWELLGADVNHVDETGATPLAALLAKKSFAETLALMETWETWSNGQVEHNTAPGFSHICMCNIMIYMITASVFIKYRFYRHVAHRHQHHCHHDAMLRPTSSRQSSKISKSDVAATLSALLEAGAIHWSSRCSVSRWLCFWAQLECRRSPSTSAFNSSSNCSWWDSISGRSLQSSWCCRCTTILVAVLRPLPKGNNPAQLSPSIRKEVTQGPSVGELAKPWAKNGCKMAAKWLQKILWEVAWDSGST